jgi:hypothetical protein
MRVIRASYIKRSLDTKNQLTLKGPFVLVIDTDIVTNHDCYMMENGELLRDGEQLNSGVILVKHVRMNFVHMHPYGQLPNYLVF